MSTSETQREQQQEQNPEDEQVAKAEEPPLTSELFNSVIMRPVEFPYCFAAMTPIYSMVSKNGLDVNTVANAIGTFLNSDTVNYLYIAGYQNSHADNFFEDLRNCLEEEPEIGFYSNPLMCKQGPHPKKIVRTHDLDPQVPTLPEEHKILELRLTSDNYEEFTPEDFSSFIYCGNSVHGPKPQYQCRDPRGLLCVRRRMSNRKGCGVCFWIPMKGKMEEPYLLDFIDELEEHHTDDGAVCEPLGVPHKVYTEFLTSTDENNFDSQETYDSECDW